MGDPSQRGASERDKPTDPASLASDPELLAKIQKAIEDVNGTVSRPKDPQVQVLPRDWPQEAGELSLKLSLRRHVVTKNHAEDIEKLNA